MELSLPITLNRFNFYYVRLASKLFKYSYLKIKICLFLTKYSNLNILFVPVHNILLEINNNYYGNR